MKIKFFLQLKNNIIRTLFTMFRKKTKGGQLCKDENGNFTYETQKDSNTINAKNSIFLPRDVGSITQFTLEQNILSTVKDSVQKLQNNALESDEKNKTQKKLEEAVGNYADNIFERVKNWIQNDPNHSYYIVDATLFPSSVPNTAITKEEMEKIHKIIIDAFRENKSPLIDYEVYKRENKQQMYGSIQKVIAHIANGHIGRFSKAAGFFSLTHFSADIFQNSDITKQNLETLQNQILLYDIKKIITEAACYDKKTCLYIVRIHNRYLNLKPIKDLDITNYDLVNANCAIGIMKEASHKINRDSINPLATIKMIVANIVSDNKHNFTDEEKNDTMRVFKWTGIDRTLYEVREDEENLKKYPNSLVNADSLNSLTDHSTNDKPPSNSFN